MVGGSTFIRYKLARLSTNTGTCATARVPVYRPLRLSCHLSLVASIICTKICWLDATVGTLERRRKRRLTLPHRI